MAFTDDNADDGNHVYNVTVVYQSKSGDTNESGFSNDVYTIDGKTVAKDAKSLEGLPRGIYIINDKKYIIR